MKSSKVTNNPDRVKKVQNFLSGSVDDYIAARVLFLSSLPQQAAILSSTSIEKCFKAILAFNGNEIFAPIELINANLLVIGC